MPATGARGFGKAVRGRRFLSLPARRSDWLRILLLALSAYLITFEAVYLFGYRIPPLERLSPAAAVIGPFVLLVIGSSAAFFVNRRLGAVFTVAWVVIGAVAVLVPAY